MADAHGLQLALDLFEAAEELMRQNLRRAHPDAPEEAIERRLVAWLQDRPGAPHGDAAGTARSWPDLQT
jgi:Rv0078B-related antitoxin